MHQGTKAKKPLQYELLGRFSSEVDQTLLIRFLSGLPPEHGPFELIAETRLPGLRGKAGTFECSGTFRSERDVVDVILQGADVAGKSAPRIKAIVRRRRESFSSPEAEKPSFLPPVRVRKGRSGEEPPSS